VIERQKQTHTFLAGHRIFTMLYSRLANVLNDIGGVYPLSATIASESSDNASRGMSASLVFSMQVSH